MGKAYGITVHWFSAVNLTENWKCIWGNCWNGLEKLAGNGISPKNVCFDDEITDDVFCVRNNYNTFEVFYRERGKEYHMQRFSTLSQALEYLYDAIIKITPEK